MRPMQTLTRTETYEIHKLILLSFSRRLDVFPQLDEEDLVVSVGSIARSRLLNA